ncbi:hypothetical protein CSKR_108288 [Clonorchis sinensis]|uniref:Uncharacterized protein n=1 Tax=Clonorchis sinensis TaxID=79923 RepID=A0A3R7H1B4_CLOSI|nr:hypothetical protein CSKR_108288 [Clonorchis sinensis]
MLEQHHVSPNPPYTFRFKKNRARTHCPCPSCYGYRRVIPIFFLSAMDVFHHDEIIVHLLDARVKCVCDGCKLESVEDGVTFVVFEKEIWLERLNVSDAVKRLKPSTDCIRKHDYALALSSPAQKLLEEACRKLFPISGELDFIHQLDCSLSDDHLSVAEQCTTLGSTSLIDTNADTEEQRRMELQRKLARELEKSKSKRNKKGGILRK